MIKKFGFLFGAGAEIKYGLPSGGKFALDIFRRDTTLSKKSFKEMLNNVTESTQYESDWLPDNYRTRNVSVFGKSIFQNIIKGTIEHSKDKIIENLIRFDDLAKIECEKLKKQSNVDIDTILKKDFGIPVGNCFLKKQIIFIQEFSDGNKIFGSKYFSALMALYKSKKLEGIDQKNNYKSDLGRILLAILQLGIGAISEKISNKINDSIFEHRDDSFDFLDDIGDILQLNYSAAGLSGIEFLLENREYDLIQPCEIVLFFAKRILESMFSSVLDYKSLIDSYWHYLYCPKTDWAKFCKLSIFLLTVKEYLLELANNRKGKCTEGYYHMLYKAIREGKLEASTIATTNYNTFIKDVLENQEIIFLNGSVDTLYDPYVNRIGFKDTINNLENHILVPLIFTQSGTKPMTSIEMSKQYVKAYESWKSSDAVVVVGYGFGIDDEHINGMLRTLIDLNDKEIIIVTLKGKDISPEVFGEKLKIIKTDKIKIIQVDIDGQIDNNGQTWVDALIQE